MKKFSPKEKKHMPARTTHGFRQVAYCPDCTRQAGMVRQILRRPCLQAKLAVSTPDDAYEQEADRVADAVMRMPDEAI